MENANKATLSQQSRLLTILIKLFPEVHSYENSPQWAFTETLTKAQASELISQFYNGSTEQLKENFNEFLKGTRDYDPSR